MAELPKYIMLRKVNETKTGVEYQVVEELPTQSNASNVLGAMTNADRIRAMTDEDLAEQIAKCVEADFFRANVIGIKQNSKDDWLDWLKQEAGE